MECVLNIPELIFYNLNNHLSSSRFIHNLIANIKSEGKIIFTVTNNTVTNNIETNNMDTNNTERRVNIDYLKDKGLTLVELLIVIVIIAALGAISIWYIKGIKQSTSIRKQTSDLFSDLTSTQISALTNKKTYFVQFGTNPTDKIERYSIYEDTNPAPDGDGLLDSSDTRLGGFPKKTTPYNIKVTTKDGSTACTDPSILGATAPATMTDISGGIVTNVKTTISFDTQGLANVYKAIILFKYLTTDVANTVTKPEYDCIVIEKTRILRGAWDSVNKICAEK